jgi:hypothetical protein
MKQSLLANIGFQPVQLFAQLDVTVPGVLWQAVISPGKTRKLCGMPNAASARFIVTLSR